MDHGGRLCGESGGQDRADRLPVAQHAEQIDQHLRGGLPHPGKLLRRAWARGDRERSERKFRDAPGHSLGKSLLRRPSPRLQLPRERLVCPPVLGLQRVTDCFRFPGLEQSQNGRSITAQIFARHANRGLQELLLMQGLPKARLLAQPSRGGGQGRRGNGIAEALKQTEFSDHVTPWGEDGRRAPSLGSGYTTQWICSTMK